MAGERADDLAAWDASAAEYAAQSQVDWFDTFLERHLGDVEGKRVLDLGCGHGWFTHELHKRGADVVGVDGSQELLARAQGHYPEVQFEQADLRQRYVGDFDVVVALMVLMAIPDLSSLEITIRTGGVFVATILHPAFFVQETVEEGDAGYRKVRGYLNEEAWWIEGFGHWHYHRSDGCLRGLAGHSGACLVELFERRRRSTRAGVGRSPPGSDSPPVASKARDHPNRPIGPDQHDR